jgi:hypothetical protein
VALNQYPPADAIATASFQDDVTNRSAARFNELGSRPPNSKGIEMGVKSKLFVAAGVVLVGVGFLSPAASAGKPVGHVPGQVVLGARIQPAEPGAFGAGVSGFATTPEGSFGRGIQGLLAGVIPDAVAPNTCND